MGKGCSANATGETRPSQTFEEMSLAKDCWARLLGEMLPAKGCQARFLEVKAAGERFLGRPCLEDADGHMLLGNDKSRSCQRG